MKEKVIVIVGPTASGKTGLSIEVAKRLGGEFIVRMEDTDIERNVVGGEESQLEGYEWLGIHADESPLNPNPKYKGIDSS